MPEPITTHHRAAAALPPEAAVDLLEAVLHVTPGDGVIRAANPSAIELFSGASEPLIGTRLLDLFDADELTPLDALWRRASAPGAQEPVLLTKVLLAERAALATWGEVRLVPRLGGAPWVVALVHDVSARYQHQAELSRQDEALSVAIERLRQSEAKHRALVHAAEDAIMVCDLETGCFTEANPAACELFGCEEEEFKTLAPRDLHPADAAQDVSQLNLGITVEGRSWLPRVRMCRRDGTRFWADLRMRRYEVEGRSHYVAIARDVSEGVAQERQLHDSVSALRETQAQLVESARLSAMGGLAAGIAHELNQPLTAIEGFAQRIRRAPSDTIGRHDRALDIIIREARRMAGIVENIKTFGREGPFEPRPGDALVPLDNAYTLVAAQLRDRGIEVVRDTPETPPRVNIDAARMQQVFLNLMLNARDALDELPPGARRELTLRVGATPSRVCYEIEDTGPGVSRDVRARMFDPFFSTKPTGSGTGLGLSIIYAIVADHGGEIRHEDPPSGGARFVVELPVHAVD